MSRLLKRTLVGILAACAVTAASPDAHAISGLYLSLGVGYGTFTGTQLVTHEQDGAANDLPDLNAETCCPGPNLATQFRLGFSIFGFAGPEFGFVGSGWGVGGNQQGGAGFVGGGVRLFPIKFFSLFGLDNDLPIDAGIGVMFGYSIAGQDFAYEGTFWDVDFHFDFLLASFFSIGVKLDIVLPNYGSFVFTDYKNDRGRCSNNGTQDIEGGVLDKANANCTGDGPSTTLISPQLYLTFHFDPLSSD